MRDRTDAAAPAPAPDPFAPVVPVRAAATRRPAPRPPVPEPERDSGPERERDPGPEAGPELARAPRPLGEHRRWPRSFADRLTAPLPGVRAYARLAREGAFRPGPEGLRGIPDLPYEPGPLPPYRPEASASPGPDTPAGSCGSAGRPC